jgi:hypothetical protein
MAGRALAGRTRSLSVAEYYRIPAVRRRIREYCGDTDGRMTCAYLSTLGGEADPPRTWERVPPHPPHALDRLLETGADLSRSLWDLHDLLIHVDLDYQNPDAQGEAYAHPAEVFFKLEPTYRAIRHALRALDLPLYAIVTGRGYHFTGRVPLDGALVRQLAALAVEPPPWFASHQAHKPAWVGDAISALHARAYTGAGMLLEHLAHLILRRAAPASPIPVVLNGTVVGPGLLGRECTSIDLSYAGDPLDVRHIRVAFGAYQVHRLRGDVVGQRIASTVPALIAIPRHRESLFAVLEAGRSTGHAAALADTRPSHIPDVTDGASRLLADYLASKLAPFHREFYGTTPHAPAAWPETYDRLPLTDLPPCVATPLAAPNDLLLKPAQIQHVTRVLMSMGWHPRHIAGLVHSRYARDFNWGDRWARIDAATRATFDVRVFAGLVATGLDQGTDFNCTSAQEKGLCPMTTCDRDLRVDRRRLLDRVRP